MNTNAPTPAGSPQGVKRTAFRYQKYNLWIVVAITLLCLLIERVAGLSGLAIPLAVCAVYYLLIGMAYGAVWRHVALFKPSSLTLFYMAAPAVRLVIGALVCAEYGLLVYERHLVIRFVAIFVCFYVVSRVFEALYFARAEKKNHHH